MDLLFRIIYAAHARGTHHKLALDGLRYLSGPAGPAWKRVLLKHAKDLIAGSKAPDDEFKDFKNHVLHVRDGFWGGAPEKARSWYSHLVEVLEGQDWRSAAWCAGILSHYVTDPIHPFHTAQSEAENNIHRAVEWSINRSYDALRRQADAEFATGAVSLGDGADWLERAIADGATRANASYEKLIAHYDFTRGVVEPTAGLDQVGNRICAELIAYAAELFGKVLDRALAEARVAPPEVSLTLETVLAAVEMPIKQLQKRLADAADRRQVERMYDELVATGTVERTLPEDDRMVRDLHRAEVLAKQPAADVTGRYKPAPRERIETSVARRRREEQDAAVAASVAPGVKPAPVPAAPESVQPKAAEPIPPPAVGAARGADWVSPPAPITRDRRPPIVADDGAPDEPEADPRARPREDEAVVAPPPASAPTIKPDPTSPSLLARLGARAETFLDGPREAMAAPVPATTARILPLKAPEPRRTPEPVAVPAPAAREEREPRAGRSRVTRSSDVVDAPSIGPKTAERLNAAGVRSIGNLIDAEPAALAAKLATRHISAETIRDWQDQTRLVLAVPVLRGTHAQLLVGAGIRTAEALRDAEPAELCSAVLTFATKAEGQRILRQGDPPDIEKIKSWVDAAKAALAA